MYGCATSFLTKSSSACFQWLSTNWLTSLHIVVIMYFMVYFYLKQMYSYNYNVSMWLYS